MSVIVVGASHRTADLGQLERLAVPGDDLPKALTQLVELPHVAEAVILSTCNRVEVYASVSRFHPGLDEVRGWMAGRAGIDIAELDRVTFTHFETPAVEHLFRVAAGADSMIVGEQQIAVQLKTAMERARAEGTSRTILQRVFRQAVRVGRRVRRETDITAGARSIVDVGLDAAGTAAGTDLSGRRVAIVGAGKVGALAASRLMDLDAGAVTVWNRSEDKAARLAARVGGTVASSLSEAVASADVVVCTTGAGGYVIDADDVRTAMVGRERPLVLLDLAMPRNVDPAAGQLPDVTVVDLRDIREISDGSVTGEVLAEAEHIIGAEAADFSSWLRAREVDPVISALRQRAEQVRSSELDRLSPKLAALDERQREAVEALTKGIVNTLLHDPTIRLKALADNQAAEHAVGALRDLFGLADGGDDGDDDAPAA